MYRGYKTYRHYLNAKLHALSHVIGGDETVLNGYLREFNCETVKDLSLNQARSIYKLMLELAKEFTANHKKLKELAGQGMMTDGQRRAIIKICKYTFNWSQEATFSYILETCPEHRKRLSPWEIQHSKLGKLYGLLTAQEADKIIKRLDQIKKHNKQATFEVAQAGTQDLTSKVTKESV